MSSSKPVKEGYVKFQSKKIGVWKKRWLVLRTLTTGGRSDVVLEKSESETAALMGQIKRIINLKNTLSITRMPDSQKRHAISILLEGTLEVVAFALESESEANQWLEAINNERSSPNSGSKDKFNMYAMRNSKLPIQGECVLQVSATHLTILNSHQQEVIQWPLNKLRKYSVERGIFSVEAGRSSATGEGVFLFEGDDAEGVYQRINFLVKSAAANRPARLMVSQFDDAPPPYDMQNNSNHSNFRYNDDCASVCSSAYGGGRQGSGAASTYSYSSGSSEWGSR